MNQNKEILFLQNQLLDILKNCKHIFKDYKDKLENLEKLILSVHSEIKDLLIKEDNEAIGISLVLCNDIQLLPMELIDELIKNSESINLPEAIKKSLYDVKKEIIFLNKEKVAEDTRKKYYQLFKNNTIKNENNSTNISRRK